MKKDVWNNVPSGGPGAADARKRPKTRSPVAGERLTLAPLENCVGWYLTHYRNGRTKPCLGSLCSCQKADKPVPKRWQGYILALEMPLRRVVLAMLTRNCWDTCPDIRSDGPPLRGAQLILTRKGGAQGIVEVGVIPGFYATAGLPELPYTHRDQLVRVWFSGLDDCVDVARAFEIDGRSDPLFTAEEEEEREGGGE